jgi:hypothetical protein
MKKGINNFHYKQLQEKTILSEASDLQGKLDVSEAKNRLNNWVAVSVAIISIFMGITKVKDDNIVQSMNQAKSDAVDRWNQYQAVRIKAHMAELGINQVKDLQLLQKGTPGSEFSSQLKGYDKAIAHYQSEETVLARNARELEKLYDALNYRDDQFDLSDASLSISMASLAVTSLTGNRKLFILAWIFGGFGLIMGLAGLIGLALHPGTLIKLLS